MNKDQAEKATLSLVVFGQEPPRGGWADGRVWGPREGSAWSLRVDTALHPVAEPPSPAWPLAGWGRFPCAHGGRTAVSRGCCSLDVWILLPSPSFSRVPHPCLPWASHRPSLACTAEAKTKPQLELMPPQCE